MFENNHIFTDLQKPVKNVTGITPCGLLLNHLKSSITNHSEVISNERAAIQQVSGICRDIPLHQPM